MQDSIKQQNTFTTIAAANVQVTAIATMGVMNGSSIPTQLRVYRGACRQVAIAIATPKFKVKVIS